MELHHVLTQAAWNAALPSGLYEPPELARDGFLHCCTPEQLAFVLERHFAGATGLAVIAFETDSVTAELRWVESEPGQPAFPHLYGPIPLTAVLEVREVQGNIRSGAGT